MSTTVRAIRCTPQTVFDVLANGWLYPSWVVGASRMRDVDEAWPQPGSQLHHSVGTWPFLLDDRTRCEEWNPPHRAVLRAKGWPIGEARVVVDVRPRGDGCVVRMQENAVAGPATLVPRPVADIMLHLRNRETLLRLAYIAEGHESRPEPSTAERERAEDGEPAEPGEEDAS
ncbi:SRPBCC family protein [Microbacterium sp. NPDC078428]|uniref:SRPBCC family protein n=1 Tax=Microbacterium sp. NPDC078428 TaxID=3364190 RepID=UPI0037CAC413